MPKPDLLQDCRQRLEELLWSLWTELGVPGWERKHQDWWIDPESLLLFTATLDPIDPRLREEALKWCLRHRRFLSEGRVKSLLAAPRFGDSSRYQPQLGRFLKTLSIAASLQTTELVQSYSVTPNAASPLRSLDRAALLSLRLRALLGVAAKAEIVRVFLAEPGEALTATDLVREEVGYTKRAIRDALEDLRVGGFADLEVRGNTKKYQFQARRSFPHLFDPVPVAFPKWWSLFAVLRGVLDLAERIGSFRTATRPIEIRRSMTSLAPEMSGAGIRPPVLERGTDGPAQFEAWTRELFESLASIPNETG